MKIVAIGILVLTVYLGACEPARPAMSPEEAVIAEQLSGEWEMRLRVTHSPVLDFDSARAPSEIRGKISLLPNNSLGRSFPEIGVATDYGTYDIDLSPFGLDPRERGKPPTAVAGRIVGDSVEIILSPDGNSGSLNMSGRVDARGIRGVWSMTLRAVGGSGTFDLERPHSVR